MDCLEYRDPLTLKDSIADYAKRLVDDLPALDEPPILIGMSLGGTIATEMAKLMPHKQLVLISSFKHRSETPLLFKIAKILPLHIFIPAWSTRIFVPFFARIFGICTKEESQIIKAMFQARTAKHFAWARRAIVKWNNEHYPERYLHINGTRDHIFKSAEKQTTHLIKGGSHNMVMDRAEEIAAIINKEVLDL